MLENFIYAKRKDLFTAELDAGNILNEAVVFIEDTKEIWNHGTYFDGSTFDPSNIELSILNIIDSYATKAEIPTKVSQLENDANYIQDDVIGIYIYDTDGRFTLPENWNTTNNSKAVGVAILTDNCKFVVAKSDIGTNEWGGYGTDIPTLTNYTTEELAATDFDGVNNTSKIIAAIGSSNAAGDCAAYTFPNGKTGYLGAGGEWQVARQNKEDLNSALTLIGGTTMTADAYWTSTEYSSNYTWIQWFDSDSYLSGYGGKGSNRYVRAFLALEIKPLKERVSDLESNKADKTEIPTKVSLLENDVPYVVDDTLPANGLYIYDINGNFTLPENWDTANNSKAVGVAILTDDCRFVVAKEDAKSSYVSWGGYGTDIAGLTNYTSSTEADKDFAGITNTQVIIDAIGKTTDGYRTGSAAQDCVDYIFPNGQAGYLGAAGEWQLARQNKEDLNSALTLIGGTTMKESAYWTSTEYSSDIAWVQYFGSYSDLDYYGKASIRYVRAFLAIEGQKSIKDRLDDIENNYVTLDTNQSITGIKTFESPIKVELLQTPTTDESGMLLPGPVLIRYYNNGFQDVVSFYSGINMENLTPINYYNSNMTGGNIQIIAQDNYFNTGGGSVTIGNKDTSDTEHAICSYVSVVGSETRNKIIVLGINNDTKIKGLNFDNQNCTELFTDNLLLSSVLEEGDTSGALFNWIKNENRLNIKGLNGNYYNATNLSYGNIKMSINDKPISTESSTSVTSLSSLSIDHNLVVAKLSGSQSFSLSSIPNAGREIHVLVNNTGTSDITITLPTASPYVPVNGDHTTVPVGGYAEINAISDGTKIYLRAL